MFGNEAKYSHITGGWGGGELNLPFPIPLNWSPVTVKSYPLALGPNLLGLQTLTCVLHAPLLCSLLWARFKPHLSYSSTIIFLKYLSNITIMHEDLWICNHQK